MTKLILASLSGIALLGLAACSDTDGTTTQAVPEQGAPATTDPGAAPSDPMAPPAGDPAPAPAAPAN